MIKRVTSNGSQVLRRFLLMFTASIFLTGCATTQNVGSFSQSVSWETGQTIGVTGSNYGVSQRVLCAGLVGSGNCIEEVGCNLSISLTNPSTNTVRIFGQVFALNSGQIVDDFYVSETLPAGTSKALTEFVAHPGLCDLLELNWEDVGLTNR